MKINKFLFTAFLIFSCLQFWTCSNSKDEHKTEHPAEVEEIEGTDLTTITLTEKAIERIGLQTTAVISEHSSPVRLVVPYSAIIYDSKGQTWVYTSPQERTFVRHKIDVDYIDGNKVYLTNGPPEGTLVAKVGVAELYGTEFKVGH